MKDDTASLAPIVLFVYNRPKHTRQILDALARANLSKESELYIFSDGPKCEDDIDSVIAVRDIISDETIKDSFKNVYLELRDVNLGLEKSVIDSVTMIMDKYGRAIVLEDDIVVSVDFLMFLNKALDSFINDSNVWSISGYSLCSRRLNCTKDDILWTYRGECWGWASWKNRWDKVDWQVRDYDTFLKDKTAQRQFNRGGRDLTYLLKKWHRGQIRSWAIRWCYSQYKENMITVFPKHPKAYNIGFDGSGTSSANSMEQREATSYSFIEEKEWNMNYNMNNKLLYCLFKHKYAKMYWRQRLGAVWYTLTDYEEFV